MLVRLPHSEVKVLYIPHTLGFADKVPRDRVYVSTSVLSRRRAEGGHIDCVLRREPDAIRL